MLGNVRADRLVATLLLLQTRGRVTAAEVAAELEVSERTARRDLDALSAAGLPVYATQGRNGGWALLGGARTDLSGLNAAEARALFLVAGPSSNATPELKAALRKLVRALPEPFRAGAQAASTAVVIDPAGWGRTVSTAEPPHLAELQRAVVDGVQVDLEYTDREGSATTRRVHPLGLVTKGTVWYLIANTANGLRTFRVWRVRAVVVTDDPVERPDGFDLAAEWQRVSATVDDFRSQTRARVLVHADKVPMVSGMFGRRARVVGPAPDGRVEFELGAARPHVLAVELAGFGGAVEVLDPPEVRAELARIARELTEVYGPD